MGGRRAKRRYPQWQAWRGRQRRSWRVWGSPSFALPSEHTTPCTATVCDVVLENALIYVAMQPHSQTWKRTAWDEGSSCVKEIRLSDHTEVACQHSYFTAWTSNVWQVASFTSATVPPLCPRESGAG